MSKPKQVLLELGRRDAALLESLREHLGTTRATLLRWALRYFALEGPWPASRQELLKVVGDTEEPLDLGPIRRRPGR